MAHTPRKIQLFIKVVQCHLAEFTESTPKDFNPLTSTHISLNGIKLHQHSLHLKITRGYAFNGDIEGDCPGSMCHSARLTPPNPPTSKKKSINGVNDVLIKKKRVGTF